MTTHPDQSSESREDRIRALAFSIWEEEGQPEGKADEHWRIASDIIDAADMTGSSEGDPAWLQRQEETATPPGSAPSDASDETIASAPTRLQKRSGKA